MTTPSKSTTSGVRASDAERETVATRLREAVSAGFLTLAEADERQATAYAAVTREDLVPLTVDLPSPKKATTVPGRRGPVTTGARRRLAVHAAIVGFLAVFLVTRWAMDPAPFFWPVWPVFWLGLSLLLHHRFASRTPTPTTV